MFYTLCVTTSHSNSKWIQKVSENGPAVASLAVVSFILNIYIIICLALSAIRSWNDRVMNDADLNALFADCDGMCINLAPMIIALFFDILSFFDPCINFSFMHFNMWCKTYKSYALVVLSLTVFCPMFCILAHSPYIAIAYLNDGDHASSIFVYYTIPVYMFLVCCGCFSVGVNINQKLQWKKMLLQIILISLACHKCLKTCVIMSRKELQLSVPSLLPSFYLV